MPDYRGLIYVTSFESENTSIALQTIGNKMDTVLVENVSRDGCSQDEDTVDTNTRLITL